MAEQLLRLLRDLVNVTIPDLGVGVRAELTTSLLRLVQNLLTLLNAIAVLCPAFATALTTCTGAPLATVEADLEALLELLGAASPSLVDIDASLEALVELFPVLLACALPALSGCFTGTPGQACCPGFGGGAPISISINNTNTASNDDRDQVQAQSAGKDANQNQTQVHTDVTAGRDALVQIDAFQKKFSEFDDKLKYLFCKLKSEVHEQDHHKCKCKVSCKKH